MHFAQPTSTAGNADTRPYLWTLLAYAICAGVLVVVRPYFQSNAPLGLMLIPVVFGAVHGGGGPALAASLLGLMINTQMFIEPADSLVLPSSEDRLHLLLYGVICLTITALGALLGQARRAARVLLTSLHASEQTTRAVLEAAPHAVLGVDGHGIVRIASSAVRQVFGYEPEEVRGRPVSLLVPTGLPVPEEQCTARHALHELQGLRKDGSAVPLEAGMGVTDTPSGRLLVSYLCDITERKRIEQELLRERSELTSIMAHSPVLISIKDLAGRFTMANDSFLRTFGKRREDVIGRSAADLFPRELAELMDRTDREVLANRAPQETEVTFDTTGGRAHMHSVKFPLGYLGTEELFGVCTFGIDITEQKRAAEQVRHAARHDPLTGLPNRALVYELGGHMLATAGRSGLQVAVLFFDLDRFKPINDTYGHTTGDKMLQEVARRLKTEVRSSDMVGRLGGDEFIAVLSEVRDEADVVHAAAHLLACLSQPYHIDALRLRTSPSIGIAMYPHDGGDIDTLIRHADAAMYHAKNRGRNNYQFFTPEINANAANAFALEQNLRHSVERSELELVYQPVIDTRTGQVVAAEALLRWQREAELLMPGQFIGPAETSGLILQIGEWVIREACRQHAQWRKMGLPPLRIAVNVSPVQFRDPYFQGRVRNAMGEAGIDPGWFELEVTESTVMKQVDEAARTLAGLKQLGVRIALDDFGTGYSSLSYLSQFPIDKLKVDQSFIRNIEHDRRSLAIAETVIALGNRLGVEVVAEGIESEEALDLLRQRGCDQGQGYAISAPLRPELFVEWYRANDARQLYH